MDNIQTFSQDSDQYAKHRPQYPDVLFTYLSGLCKEHICVWDCATGNGQAAGAISKYFLRVEATDLSAEQIQYANQYPNVSYSVTPAEKTSFADEMFDLVTVAQAVHWFEQELFFEEVQRVLKPDGVLAIWSYGFLAITPVIDKIIEKELLEPIEPFWASGNRMIMNGYRDLVLPFESIEVEKNFYIQVEWNLVQLLDYFRTWSGVKRYKAEVGIDPVENLEKVLKEKWHLQAVKFVQMPLVLKASRKVTRQTRR
jgi:SAM-dependent methyltransferase